MYFDDRRFADLDAELEKFAVNSRRGLTRGLALLISRISYRLYRNLPTVVRTLSANANRAESLTVFMAPHCRL